MKSATYAPETTLFCCSRASVAQKTCLPKCSVPCLYLGHAIMPRPFSTILMSHRRAHVTNRTSKRAAQLLKRRHCPTQHYSVRIIAPFYFSYHIPGSKNSHNPFQSICVSNRSFSSIFSRFPMYCAPNPFPRGSDLVPSTVKTKLTICPQTLRR